MEHFTVEDYKALLADIMSGVKTISADIDQEPELSAFTHVNYEGSIK